MKIFNFILLLVFLQSAAWADVPKTGGKHDTVTVEVEATGRTFEEAKRNGFREAIEQVVGSLLVSDQEVRGAQLVRDNIANYSAGYVDDFEIIDSNQDPETKLWTVEMKVSVASSKIAKRMLVSGETTQDINGAKAEAMYVTQKEQRDNGDNLLSMVMSSYPQKAYVINRGQPELKINKSRAPFIEIPYRIEMSRYWLESLIESLQTVSLKNTDCSLLTANLLQGVSHERTGYSTNVMTDKVCGRAPDMRVYIKRSNDYFPTVHSFYFHDNYTLSMMNSELQPPMGQQHFGLRVDLIDIHGDVMDSRCANINNELFVRYSEPNQGVTNLNNRSAHLRPDIVGQNVMTGTLRLNITNLTNVNSLAKLKLSIEKSCS